MIKSNVLATELVTFKNSQDLEARGTILKLAQNFIVFEVYNPYSIVQLSEVLSEMKIFRANKSIYQGNAIVTNIVNTGIVLIVSAALSDSSWKKDFDVDSKESLSTEITYLIESFDKEQEIDTEFKLCILSIRSLLHNVKNWCDKLEPSFEKSKSKIDTKFILDNFENLFTKLNTLYNQFSTLSSNLDPSVIDLYKNFVQSHLHPLILSSPFPYRCYAKPLGFAGDYMMMHMIQRENAEGPNLFAKFTNVFCSKIPIMDSVNNRTAKLITLLEEGIKRAEKENREFHSLSIGCGPAVEVKRFIQRYNPKVKCHFKLLDFNQETLDFASSEAIKEIKGKNYEVSTQLDSVHVLLKKSVNRKIEDQRYDLVYCSGLFDYLSDRICSKLTRMFFDMTKTDGKVFVTNMHSKDIDHYSLEILLEWYLIYRNEETMSSFAPKNTSKKVYTDSTGINLCLEIHN
ncbi:MAG: extracellular factor (EF) 3-hydroxypalmitic acid methyl ester biosynthesis protein [Rickettsiales bacterium]|jgi:extracellular factor (EF) 3-hydroxypalmitic acid methyl ester biosynthesis protein